MRTGLRNSRSGSVWVSSIGSEGAAGLRSPRSGKGIVTVATLHLNFLRRAARPGILGLHKKRRDATGQATEGLTPKGSSGLRRYAARTHADLAAARTPRRSWRPGQITAGAARPRRVGLQSPGMKPCGVTLFSAACPHQRPASPACKPGSGASFSHRGQMSRPAFCNNCFCPAVSPATCVTKAYARRPAEFRDAPRDAARHNHRHLQGTRKKRPDRFPSRLRLCSLPEMRHGRAIVPLTGVIRGGLTRPSQLLLMALREAQFEKPAVAPDGRDSLRQRVPSSAWKEFPAADRICLQARVCTTHTQKSHGGDCPKDAVRTTAPDSRRFTPRSDCYVPVQILKSCISGGWVSKLSGHHAGVLKSPDDLSPPSRLRRCQVSHRVAQHWDATLLAAPPQRHYLPAPGQMPDKQRHSAVKFACSGRTRRRDCLPKAPSRPAVGFRDSALRPGVLAVPERSAPDCGLKPRQKWCRGGQMTLLPCVTRHFSPSAEQRGMIAAPQHSARSSFSLPPAPAGQRKGQARVLHLLLQDGATGRRRLPPPPVSALRSVRLA